MKLPGKKRHLTDIAYISCATGIELVLVHSELTFLATNFNLVAKKKKVFGLSREQNSSSSVRPTFNPALARLLLYLLSSPSSSTSLFFPTFLQAPFLAACFQTFSPYFFPDFQRFGQAKSQRNSGKDEKKSLKLQVQKANLSEFCNESLLVLCYCFALQNPLFLKLRRECEQQQRGFNFLHHPLLLLQKSGFYDNESSFIKVELKAGP